MIRLVFTFAITLSVLKSLAIGPGGQEGNKLPNTLSVKKTNVALGSGAEGNGRPKELVQLATRGGGIGRSSRSSSNV